MTILKGEHAGVTHLSYNYLNSSPDKGKLFVPSDTAWAMLQPGSSKMVVTLIDHYRAETEMWIFAVLALAQIVFGGVIGCGALVSLVASAVIVWKLLILLLL